MRTIIRLAVALTAVLSVSPAAAGMSLDRGGSFTPAGAFEAATANGTLALINDGSFELGPPPASAWTEVSSPASERIGTWSATWYKAGYDGVYDYWAGGYDDATYSPVTSSVSQTLTLPADSAVIQFHYLSWRVDDDDSPADGDRVYVAVNGTEVWSLDMTQANNTRPEGVLTWATVVLDLRAHAGQSVTLSFGGIGVGDFTGNVRFDAVEFLSNTVPAEAQSWGGVKALYR